MRRTIQDWLLKSAMLSTALTTLVGCGPDFDPYWRILDFRVLAIASSEPQLRPGETAELTPLTYSTEDIEYAWEWCPFRTSPGDLFECPITQEELDELLSANGAPTGLLPDFDLGNGATAQLRYPAPEPVIREFCESIQAAVADAPPELAGAVSVVDCDRGFEVTVRLIAKSGEKEIVSGKRVNLWIEPQDGPDQENINPAVSQIQIRPANRTEARFLKDEGVSWVVDPEQPMDTWWVALPDDRPIEIYAEVNYEVRSLVDEASIEIWQPPAPFGSDVEFLEPESENLVYRWMTTAGTFPDPGRVYDEELNTLEDASITEFKIGRDEDAPSSDFDEDGVTDADDNCPWVSNTTQLDEDQDGVGDACTVKVWSIVRDGRLGIGWQERSLLLVGRR